MFKTNFLALALSACCAVLSAQVSTIQVTVSDTIMVPATHITVAVSFKDTTAQSPISLNYDLADTPDADGDGIPDAPAAPLAPDFSKSYRQVISLLKREGIQWKKPEEQMGFMGGLGGMMGNKDDTLSRGFVVDFSSKQQMDRVLPQIKAITFADTKEMGASVDKELVDRKRLYAKLLAKARLKADDIAGLSGKSVGDVYQIGSAFDNFSPDKYMESMMGGGGMFGGLFKMMGSMFGDKSPDYKVPISDNLTVTYYLR